MDTTYLNKIIIRKGDIIREEVDAIVNAANSSLLGGGGVDGAIHRAGGPKILKECKTIISKIGLLKTGESVMTSGGDLKAKYIIHTVGPIWRGGNSNEEILLSNAYKNSLKLASQKNIKTIAFPSISTGVYGYPKELAVKVSFKAVKESLKKYHEIDEVRFICFDDLTYNLYIELFNKKI